MATISQAPINVLAGGQNVSVLPAGQSTPYGTIVCTIYNSTNVVLAVTCAGGTRFLEPNQADSYPTSNAYPVPTITPISPQAAGTFLGVITSTFYDKNDGAPNGFPQPLTAFAGGLQQIVSSAQLETGGGIGIPISVPPGTTALVITNTSARASTLTAVMGGTSGSNYLTANIPLAAGASFTVPVSPIDSTFTILESALGLGSASVYASNVPVSPLSAVAAPVALPIPTFATKSVAISASTAAALPALTNGAYYLFGADFINGAGAAMYGEIGDSISTFAAFACQGSIAGNDGPNTVALDGYRTIGPVAVTYLVGSGIGAAFLRYALGP